MPLLDVDGGARGGARKRRQLQKTVNASPNNLLHNQSFEGSAIEI